MKRSARRCSSNDSGGDNGNGGSSAAAGNRSVGLKRRMRHMLRGHSRRHGKCSPLLASLACVAALAVVCVIALAIGSSSVGLREIFAFLSGGEVDSTARNILVNMRIPRVAAGLLAGSSLAVAGALIQAVLDNPLASPNVIGINSGAGFAVLAVSAIPALNAVGNPGLLPAAAFVGALVSAGVVFTISARSGVSRLTVVLAGVALNAVFGAGQNLVLTIAPNIYAGSSSFLVGGFSGVLLDNLAWPALFSAVGIVGALALAHTLNVLSLGAESAHALGVRVGAVRVLALAMAALLAASAVSFAGLLGFVGLIVPHVVRRFAGADNRVVIPLCAVAGAAFTVACDTFARTAFSPYELAVGIPLAVIGGPFFIYLLMRGRGFRDE